MQQYKRQSCDNVKGLFVGLKALHTLPVGLVNPTYATKTSLPKGGGAQHRRVFMINPPLIPPLKKGVRVITSLPKADCEQRAKRQRGGVGVADPFNASNQAGGGTVVPDGFVKLINPSALHPLNQTFPVGLVNPTYISMTFLSYSAALVLVFETIAGAERKRVKKINTNARIAAKFSSSKRQLLTFLIDISNVKPFNRSPIQLFNFVERFTSKKAAFTLAEVLITLGIIGVVAAMTLPALINKTQHQELQTGLKKNYTVLQQALLRAQLDTGEVVKPANYQKVEGVTKGSPLKKLLTKYIKNAQDCGGGTEKGSCIENASITGNENAKNPYKTFNGKNSVIPNWLDDGQFITTDGTLFLLESAMGDGSTVYPILITVDVNGVQKRPNRWGYDLFTFQLTDSGKLLPVGAEGTSYTDMSKYCSLTNTSNQNGVGCTYKALTDKDYWKNLK